MSKRYVEDFFGDVYFGDTLANDTEWRDRPGEVDPDDEELIKTPIDVVQMLGFDPKEFSSTKAKIGLSRFIK